MATPHLDSVSPILSVGDLPQAIAFYRDVLGFDLAWSWGTPPDIAAVCRDQVEITLTCQPGAKPAGASHLYLRTADVHACWTRVQQAGAQVLVPIADRPYGLRDFRIADPSGNELSIGQMLPGPAAH